MYMELEKGQSYLWCSCGLSKTQPFCDKSHEGTSFKPVRYVAATQGEEVLFCNCKHTQTGPFCDGAHNNLKDGYDDDDPHSEENKNIPVVDPGDDGRAVLDGGCYVANVGSIPLTSHGNMNIGSTISASTGAKHQSQFYAEVSEGISPVVSFGDRHVVVLVTQGMARVNISGRTFSVFNENGFYLRPGEAFSVDNEHTELVKIFISVCPLATEPDFIDEMPENFDDRYPLRVVGIDAKNRQAMADRFFQVLVDKNIGSDVVTQFIGEVPLSKAALHRHLYEESLVVLRGSGCMWTEGKRALVATGDVIFLPRKQVHSLQCTDPDGMMLAGVIYPGDNPSINY